MGGKELHFHVNELCPLVSVYLNRQMVFLQRLAARNQQCVMGSNDDLQLALQMVLDGAQTERRKMPNLPTIKDELSMAQAVIAVGREIAKPRTDDRTIDLACTYVLGAIGPYLKREVLKTNGFGPFRLDSVLNELMTEAENAPDEETLAKVNAELDAENEASRQFDKDGAIRFAPSTLHQARTLRGPKDDESTDGALSDEALHILAIRLAKANRQDGRNRRTDEEFNAIVDQALAEATAKDAARTQLKQAVTNALRGAGLTGEIDIKFDDDCAPDLTGWTDIRVRVKPGPIKKSFALYVTGVPKDPSQARETLGEILSAVLAIGRDSE